MSAGGVVLVIIDGISDVSIPVLHGKTPLTACRLPVLNRLAAAGQCGLMDPVSPGLACGSDTAHLALFGYEPRSLYRGRGAFEAIGDGIDMLPGDIAFKCNFAWMDVATGIVQRRCADSSKSFSDTASYLCSQLDGINLPGFPDVAVNVKHAMKHRCCVRLRAAAGSLCDRVSDTDPLVDGEVLKVAAAKDPADALAVRTAAVVNAASVALQDRLAAIYASDSRFANVAGQQSANLVLLRGASEAIQVDTPFPHLHGLLAFLIAPTKIIAGVGRAVGLPVLQVAGATGDYRTSFSNKASACVAAMLACRDQDQALSRPKQKAREWLYDLGIVHIKAVDDAVRFPQACGQPLCSLLFRFNKMKIPIGDFANTSFA